MAQTYTRQSSFADGDTVTAALFNNEYNQLVNAFAYSSSSASSTGHRHDGTAGQGGNIHTIGDLDFLNKIVVDDSNNRWGVFVEVSSAAVEQIRIQDGAIVPVTDSDIDLGTTGVRFKDAYIDTVTTTGNVAVGGNLTVTGTTTFNGGTITMGDAATDNVVFGADIDSNIIPDDDDSYDLGSSSQQWKDLYIDGTANIDSLVADTADINGGTVDGAIIGGSSAAAITGTTITGTAITGTSFVIGSADINEAELETIDGVTAGTVAASKAIVVDSNKDFTGARNITLTGELDAGSLDVSGDVDVDGTLETDALSINGTAVTSTAAELNILDGVTSTAAELNILDGVTSTATELNILDGVTASATDINLIDGITNGTVIASKAIITDANKDISGGRNITISGELDAATLDISGDADIDGTLEADAITIGGVTLAETISDTVGAMVSSNTESNISVTYEDSDNTLDFALPAALEITTSVGVGGGSTNGIVLEQGGIKIKNGGTQSYVDFYCESSNAHYSRLQAAAHSAYSGNVTVTLPATTGTLALTSDNVASATTLATARTIGGTSFDGSANIAVALSATATALATARTIHGVSFDGTANIDLSEVVQDTVGAMFSSNTETGIAATYEDGDGTIDLVIGNDVIVNSMIADDAIDSAQIADGAIDTVHIANDQVTGDKLANDITIANNLTVAGNLAVTGTTTQTGSVVSDSNFTGLLDENTGNSSDFGFYGKYVESSTTKYAGLFFDASTDNTFRLFTDTQTVPGTTVNTGATGYAAADLIAAGITGTTGTFSGDLNVDSGVLFADVSTNRIGINQTTPTVSIDAGSNTDAILIPKGTTAQRPTAAEGLFRYNTTTSQFEGYTSEWGAIAGSGGSGGSSSSFVRDEFTGNGSTTAFTLSKAISANNEDRLIIFNEGVFQRQDSYTLSGTTLTFDTAPANGNKVVAYIMEVGVVGTAPSVDTMTGDGSDTTLALSVSPSNENATFVTIDGVFQHKDTYAVSGSTLTFSEAPPTGTKVECTTFTNTTVATIELKDSDGDTKIQVEESTDEDKIRFDTGGTERMIIDSTGVGIGTSSPTNKAHIYKAASGRAWSADGADVLAIENNDSVALDIRCPDANQGLILFSDASARARGVFGYAHASDYIYISTAGSERMRIDSSGNVGIGTTSPGELLELVSADPRIRLRDSTAGGASGNGGKIEFMGHHAGATDGSRIFAEIHGLKNNSTGGDTHGDMIFKTNQGSTSTTEGMRLNKDGDFIVGDTDFPNGNNSAFGAAAGGTTSVSRAATNLQTQMFFQNPNGTVGTIKTTGTTTQFNTSSDYRLKENVVTDWDGTTLLKQLKPCKFNFIADANITVQGFLAHEVASIVPEAVSGEKDDVYTEADEKNREGTQGQPKYQGIDQSKLVPLLVKTIQELEARITTLEG